MRLPSLKNFALSHKRVLLRTDFNVPMKDGEVVDDFRIRAAVPTIEYLIQKKARPIIISHLGRPDGWDEKHSLEAAARDLAEILKRKFIVIDESRSEIPDYDVAHLFFFKLDLMRQDLLPKLEKLQDGDVAVLENLRFYPGEKSNAADFAKKLASLGEVYVNEAFSNAHREHASIVGIPKYLPACAGLGLEGEINALTKVIHHPKKPMVVIVGGVKLSDKAAAVKNLIKNADYVLLGGGLANLFLRIRGFEIGKSISMEKGEDKLARQLWRDYREKIKLPVDVIVSRSRDGAPECVMVEKVKPEHYILDLGPKTILQYSDYIKKAKTLIWNGPLGHIEQDAFAHATRALGRLFASRAKPSVFTVAGGGETLEMIGKLGLAEHISHVSTGGGAMLKLLGGESLPGLEILTAKEA